MSLIKDHPNNDISTDSGVKPTLGGGPVSAWAMDTATATAAYWSDLATINLGSIDNADASFRLLLSCGEGTSLTTVDLLVICKQTTAISSTESKVQVISLTDSTNVTNDDFKLIASATTKGTDIHLWMQSETAVKWRVMELSRQINSDSSTPIIYNNGSTWTVTTPTGTVDVNSGWAGSGTWTPTIIGLTTAGTGTYTTQLGYYQQNGPIMTLTGRISWTAHTGTGNMAIGGFPVANASGHQSAMQAMHQNITGTGDLAIYIGSGFNYGLLYSVSLGSAWANLAVDTAGDIVFTITYRTSS